MDGTGRSASRLPRSRNTIIGEEAEVVNEVMKVLSVVLKKCVCYLNKEGQNTRKCRTFLVNYNQLRDIVFKYCILESNVEMKECTVFVCADPANPIAAGKFSLDGQGQGLMKNWLHLTGNGFIFWCQSESIRPDNSMR